MEQKGGKIPVNKKLPDRGIELESMFRGIMFASLCIFALPVIVSIFILTAAVLNGVQGSLPSVLFPDSYWRSLLSFGFRISLIPGIAYLTYRGLSRLPDRSVEKRLALVLVSLMLLTAFVVMPPRQQPRVALSGVDLKPQPVREVVYKADSRKGGAVDKKKAPLSGSRPRHS
jgi:hypothetical protein